MSVVQRYARYRAPDESGAKLIVPSWDEMGELLRAAPEWRAAADVSVLGQSLDDLTAAARRELLDRAAAYVCTYAPDATFERRLTSPFILTGHQPDLVHPGVWLKNFAADALAREHGGQALHLVIDADACRSSSIRVPTGNVDSPRFESIEFDRPTAIVPWEERGIVDRDCWRSFAERVRRATTPLLAQRLLDQWWAGAVEQSESTGLIGASLAQARHAAELQWKCRNAELPQSQMCQSSAFRRFACHLLAGLPRFVQAYNSALATYRRERRLRNHAQPVPDLAQDGPWLEAPFWIWTSADPVRRPVYARTQSGAVVVSDRHRFEGTLPSDASDAEEAIAAIARWEADGIKLRPRALVTTMFARMAVADLFLHGIGGARYDEVTDAVCTRFFGIAPPPYATLSGTLRLPIDHPPGDRREVGRLRQRLRDLEFHPERFTYELPGGSRNGVAPAELVAKKQRWLDAPQSSEKAKQRHEGITAANRGLRSLVADQRQVSERKLAEAIERARANRILDSREYAFCLYPRDCLEEFLLDFPANPL